MFKREPTVGGRRPPESISPEPHASQPWYRRLYVWVLVGMAAGAITGLLAPKLGSSLEVPARW